MACTPQDEHLPGTLNVEADVCNMCSGWFWTWPMHNKSCHLRVTTYMTALCCLHSTTNHQFSTTTVVSQYCQFRPCGQRGRGKMGAKSAVPLTLRMRSQLRAMQRAQTKAAAVPPRIHQFGLTSVPFGPDLFAAATWSGSPQRLAPFDSDVKGCR